MNQFIQETQLLSPIFVYAQYLEAEIIMIDIHEHYQKRSWRNRYSILTSQGSLTLSVPLQKGKNQQMPVKEVRISYDENWVDVHIKSIRSAYQKSPYFDYYFDKITHCFKAKHEKLEELNKHLLETILAMLHLQKTIINSDKYVPLKSVMEFPKTEVETYTQVWSEKFPFYPNLSILDALFCLGPDTKNYLKRLL